MARACACKNIAGVLGVCNCTATKVVAGAYDCKEDIAMVLEACSHKEDTTKAASACHHKEDTAGVTGAFWHNIDMEVAAKAAKAPRHVAA